MATRYSDLDLDFIAHPATSDVSRKVDVEAVKRSVRNLVNLSFGQKPFHPEIGSGVRKLLFENLTPLTALNIRNAIVQTLTNFEPRVDLLQVIVGADPDSNTYNVTIEFNIKNIPQPIIVNIILARLR